MRPQNKFLLSLYYVKLIFMIFINFLNVSMNYVCCSTVHEFPFWLITFLNNDLRHIENSWQQKNYRIPPILLPSDIMAENQ